MISENTQTRNKVRNGINDITRTENWDGVKRTPNAEEVRGYHAKLKDIAENLYKHNIDNMMNGNAASTQPGIKLIKKHVWKLAEELETMLEGVKGVSNLKPLLQYCKLQPVSSKEDFSSRCKELALMGLSTLVNLALNVSDKNIQGFSYSQTAKSLGKKLVNAMLDDYKAQENRVKYENSQAVKADKTVRRYKPKSMADIKIEVLGRKAWSEEEQAHKELEIKAGAVLITLVLDLTEFATIEKRRVSSKSRFFRNIEINPEVLDEVKEMISNGASQADYYAPDITKPNQWRNKTYEGNVCGIQKRNGKPLVRNARYNKQNKEENHIAKMDETLHTTEAMPKVFKVLDTIESTEWTIDCDMIKTIKECIEANVEIPGINENIIIPVKPPTKWSFRIDEQGSEEPVFDLEAFDKECSEYREVNPDFFESKENTELVREWYKLYKTKVSNSSKCAAGMRSIETAEALQEYEKIYFAHNLCTRGRIYPIATSLNPQLNDVSKGLLKFAEGDVVDEEALGWLEVNLANAWGNEVEVELTDQEALEEMEFLRQFV